MDAETVISQVSSFFRGPAMFEDLRDLPECDTEEGLITTVIFAAIGILMTTLLLYGAHNEKPQFMQPTVIFDMLGIVICSVAVLVISFNLFFFDVLEGFIFILVGALIVVLSTFFWVVIYSYYRKLEERRYPFPATSLDNAGQEVLMHLTIFKSGDIHLPYMRIITSFFL